MILRRSRAAFVAASILSLPIALSPVFTTPAAAQWVVFDPSNYAQNILTAARTLQSVNQQITQLQNEATMLINQARNLASLPYSSLQQLQQSVQRTQALLSQAQNIAFDVQQIDRAFQQQYGNVSMSASDSLHRDLAAYADVLAQETGRPATDPVRLIGPMLERFMSTDRAFAKIRRSAVKANQMKEQR